MEDKDLRHYGATINSNLTKSRMIEETTTEGRENKDFNKIPTRLLRSFSARRKLEH